MASPATTTAQPVDFNLDRLTDDSEFLGVIVVDESTQGDYGPQWHYAIKPVDYDLGGTTGAYHEYVSTDKNTQRSKFGIALTAFVTVFGAGSFKKCGAGEMVGTVAMFKRVNQKFGKDRNTRQDNIVEMILPMRKPTAEEIERAKGKMAGNVSQPAANPSTFSPDEIEAIRALVVGKDATKATAAVVKSKLATNLKGAVLNGTALPALVEQGHLLVDDEGKFQIPTSEDEPDDNDESEDEDSEDDDSE